MTYRDPDNLPYPDRYAIVVKGGKNIRSTPDATSNSNIRRKTIENEQLPVIGITKKVDGAWARVPCGWIHLKTAIKTAKSLAGVALVPDADISGLGAISFEDILKKYGKPIAESLSPLTEGLIKMDVPKEVKVGVNVGGTPTINIKTNFGDLFKKNWPWFAASGIIAISIIGTVLAVTRKK